jgi:hypothetical protein
MSSASDTRGDSVPETLPLAEAENYGFPFFKKGTKYWDAERMGWCKTAYVPDFDTQPEWDDVMCSPNTLFRPKEKKKPEPVAVVDSKKKGKKNKGDKDQPVKTVAAPPAKRAKVDAEEKKDKDEVKPNGSVMDAEKEKEKEKEKSGGFTKMYWSRLSIHDKPEKVTQLSTDLLFLATELFQKSYDATIPEDALQYISCSYSKSEEYAKPLIFLQYRTTEEDYRKRKFVGQVNLTLASYMPWSQNNNRKIWKEYKHVEDEDVLGVLKRLFEFLESETATYKPGKPRRVAKKEKKETETVTETEKKDTDGQTDADLDAIVIDAVEVAHGPSLSRSSLAIPPELDVSSTI